MKKLSGVFICLLLFTFISSARIIEVADAGITDKLRAVIAAKNAGGAPPPSYYTTETFEGSTDCGGEEADFCDSAWTVEYDGTTWAEYTADPLQGSSSLRVDYQERSKTISVSGGTYYLALHIKTPASFSATNSVYFSLNDTDICGVHIDASGNLGILYSNSATTATTALSTSTEYYIQVKYIPGTSNDGKVYAYYCVPGNCDQQGDWTAADYREETTDYSTPNQITVWFGQEYIVDDFKADDEFITY